MVGSDTAVCPECGGRLRTEETEQVCEDCGLVSDEDALDRGPEWRSFDASTRRRTGAPLTRSRHDRGLSTEIGYATGIRVTGRKRRQLARMRREHDRAQFRSKADRNRMHGFFEVRRIVSQLSLPVTVRERSCVLFESAQSEGLLQGRSLEGFAAAVVYATCRTLSVARTKTEILDVSRADDAELGAAYKALNRDLGLPTGPIDPVEYVPRYASRLGLENGVEARARRYVALLLEEGLVGGRNPSGVAAGCLYAAAKHEDDCESVTQTAAAEVADVAPVTIRSTVHQLRDLEVGPEEG